MPRTANQIATEALGELHLRSILLQVEIEELRERNAKLTAEVEQLRKQNGSNGPLLAEPEEHVEG